MGLSQTLRPPSLRRRSVLASLARPLVLLPRILLQMIFAEMFIGLLGSDHLNPTNLDPRFLKAANHLRQGPLDLPLGLSRADFQSAREVRPLLLETHNDRPQFRRTQTDEDLPLARRTGRTDRIEDLIVDALDRIPRGPDFGA